MKVCLFCEEELQDAPTYRPWLAFNISGMHFDCIEKLYETLEAVKAAPVLGVSLPLDDADSNPFYEWPEET